MTSLVRNMHQMRVVDQENQGGVVQKKTGGGAKSAARKAFGTVSTNAQHVGGGLHAKMKKKKNTTQRRVFGAIPVNSSINNGGGRGGAIKGTRKRLAKRGPPKAQRKQAAAVVEARPAADVECISKSSALVEPNYDGGVNRAAGLGALQKGSRGLTAAMAMEDESACMAKYASMGIDDDDSMVGFGGAAGGPVDMEVSSLRTGIGSAVGGSGGGDGAAFAAPTTSLGDLSDFDFSSDEDSDEDDDL